MVGDILAHHGTKGMKWGVRKDTGHEGEQTTNKKIAKLDSKFEKRSGSTNTMINLHNYAAHHMNTHELHRINTKKEYAGKDLAANPTLAAKYENEVQAAYLKHLQKAADLSRNASGTKKYSIEVSNKSNKGPGWRVSSVDVEHADSGYHIPIKRGPKGHVVTLGDADASDEMQQSVNLDDFLAHHGILGMKWGSRKGSSTSSSKSSTSSHVSTDHVRTEMHKGTVNSHGLKALSNNDLKQLNERMQLEQTYRNLNGQKPSKFESGHQRIKKVIAVGKTLNDIHNTLNGPAGKLAKSTIKTAVKGAAKTAEAASE